MSEDCDEFDEWLDCDPLRLRDAARSLAQEVEHLKADKIELLKAAGEQGKFRRHSELLNRALFELGMALGKCGPDDISFRGDYGEILHEACEIIAIYRDLSDS